MTDRLTREDMQALIGSADDVALTELLDLGVTRAELLEAIAWVENDDAMLREGRAIPAGRVGQAVEILTARDAEETLAQLS
jgi:uncharacterized protein (DUF111 family)